VQAEEALAMAEKWHEEVHSKVLTLTASGESLSRRNRVFAARMMSTLTLTRGQNLAFDTTARNAIVVLLGAILLIVFSFVR
jgi:hypothetical protein